MRHKHVALVHRALRRRNKCFITQHPFNNLQSTSGRIGKEASQMYAMHWKIVKHGVRAHERTRVDMWAS